MTVPSANISQTNAIVPAAAACLDSRFQLACMTAATAISAKAVTLTDGSCPTRPDSADFGGRHPGRHSPARMPSPRRGLGQPELGPSRLFSREVLAVGRRFLAPLGPGHPALVVWSSGGQGTE